MAPGNPVNGPITSQWRSPTSWSRLKISLNEVGVHVVLVGVMPMNVLEAGHRPLHERFAAMEKRLREEVHHLRRCRQRGLLDRPPHHLPEGGVLPVVIHRLGAHRQHDGHPAPDLDALEDFFEPPEGIGNVLHDMRGHSVGELLPPHALGQTLSRNPHRIDTRHILARRAGVVTSLPLDLVVVDAVDVEDVVLRTVDHRVEIRGDLQPTEVRGEMAHHESSAGIRTGKRRGGFDDRRRDRIPNRNGQHGEPP